MSAPMIDLQVPGQSRRWAKRVTLLVLTLLAVAVAAVFWLRHHSPSWTSLDNPAGGGQVLMQGGGRGNASLIATAAIAPNLHTVKIMVACRGEGTLVLTSAGAQVGQVACYSAGPTGYSIGMAAVTPAQIQVRAPATTIWRVAVVATM